MYIHVPHVSTPSPPSLVKVDIWFVHAGVLMSFSGLGHGPVVQLTPGIRQLWTIWVQSFAPPAAPVAAAAGAAPPGIAV